MAGQTARKVDSTPIFLNEFLKLTLPPIDCLSSQHFSSSSSTRLGPAYAPIPLSEPEPLAAWPEAGVRVWRDFHAGVRDALESLPDTEAYQHILAPAAFRKGDLPLATLLPSVHLWVIINVWQPLNRVFDLDEEKALGGYDAAGHLRPPLFIGDHLPHVAAKLPYPIPRQVVFRSPDQRGGSGAGAGAELDATKADESITALVLLREPWLVDLTSLFKPGSSSTSSSRSGPGAVGEDVEINLPPSPDASSTTTSSASPGAAAAAALAELLSYMRVSGKRYAILTTYTHFLFLRDVGAGTVAGAGIGPGESKGPIEISPLVSADDADVTVYAATWFFSRLVAAQS